MSEMIMLAPALVGGVLLGGVFFGGLWWTVHRGVSSRYAAVWFFTSLLLRMGITLAGFYFVGAGQWQRLVACLAGFLIGRLLVIRITRPSLEKPPHLTKEARHAP